MNANFLVDCKTGLIVEKGLRGEAMGRKLADLLKLTISFLSSFFSLQALVLGFNIGACSLL